MYWLFTDETNVEPSQGDFFIYGGLVMTPEQIAKVHDVIVSIRAKYGYLDTDPFKFQTASRPPQVSIEQSRAAKAEAISAAHDLGVVMLIYVVLHDIATNVGPEKTLEYALNATLAHFDMAFLAEMNSKGAVCLDRVPDKFGYAYLRSKFQGGIDLPDGRNPHLQRIIHYSISSDGASHVSSLVDVALGGLRYCINAATGSGSAEVAQEILRPLSRMMWFKPKADGEHQVGGYGFIQYPKTIKVDAYREKYERLAQTLTLWASRTTKPRAGATRARKQRSHVARPEAAWSRHVGSADPDVG